MYTVFEEQEKQAGKMAQGSGRIVGPLRAETQPSWIDTTKGIEYIYMNVWRTARLPSITSTAQGKARTAREWVTAASCPLAARPFHHWRLFHMHRGSATCVFILRGGTGSRAGMYRHRPNAPAWIDGQAPFAGVSSGIRAEPRL